MTKPFKKFTRNIKDFAEQAVATYFHFFAYLNHLNARQNNNKNFIGLYTGVPMKKICFLIFFVFLCLTGAGCYTNGDNPCKPEEPVKTIAAEKSPSGTPPGKPKDTASPSREPSSVKRKKTNTASANKTDFRKLAPTTAMSFEELVGDNGDYSAVKSYPPAGTYQLVVNLYYQVITAYTKDANGEFTIPARYMICSTGRSTDPSPRGTFKMGTQRQRFSKFQTFNVYGQYWSQITRNIFFHSVLYTKKDAKTYTASSYTGLGKKVSHGCIRMLVPDARWIYYYAAPGTAVKIIKGKKDAAMAEIKKKLTRAKLPSKRPNLRKGKIPVTEPWPGYKGAVGQNSTKKPAAPG